MHDTHFVKKKFNESSAQFHSVFITRKRFKFNQSRIKRNRHQHGANHDLFSTLRLARSNDSGHFDMIWIPY